MKANNTETAFTATRLLRCYQRDHLLQPATLRHFDYVVGLFEREVWSGDIAQLEYSGLLEWRDRVLQRASPRTWTNYLLHLRVLWNYAEREGMITENPMRQVRAIRAPHRKKKTVRIADLEQAVVLLQQPSEPLKPGWFWVAVLRTFYYTGIRRRQLVSLQWRHVDLDRATLTLFADGSKTRREWTIPLHEACIPELEELRRRTQEVTGEAELSGAQVFNVTLFSSRYRGTGMTVEQVTGFFRRLSEKLTSPDGGDFPRISPHRLRHTIATELTRGRNPDIKGVQQLLGHSDMRTTLEYLHPDLQQLQQLVGALPSL